MDSITIRCDGEEYALPVIWQDNGWIIIYDGDEDLLVSADIAVIHADDPRDSDHLRHLEYQVGHHWCILDWSEDVADHVGELEWPDNTLTASALAAERITGAITAGRVRARDAIYGVPGASPLGALLM